MSRSRWMLTLHARVMRFLMQIGMFIQKLYSPRPSGPAFSRMIPSTLAREPGFFRISVYTPPSYNKQRLTSFKSVRSGAGFSCLINFHGGGFTIGKDTDDERYIRSAIEQLDCVVLSVAYRLAPEHPFPTAVDDGADAVLWAAEHADELGIDPNCIALTGFSSGGNLTLTVPVRLHDLKKGRDRTLYRGLESDLSSTTASSPSKQTKATVSDLARDTSSSSLDPLTASSSSPFKSEAIPLRTSSPFLSRRPRPKPSSLPTFTIRALAPFYPSTDYSLSRATRQATNPNPAMNLSPALYALFDESYLFPPGEVKLDCAYLSAGHLSEDELRAVYAEMRIAGLSCEWDMLCKEGLNFAGRLRRARGAGEVDGVGDAKDVWWTVVDKVAHGWDKKPFLPAEVMRGIEGAYGSVLAEVKRVFDRGVVDT